MSTTRQHRGADGEQRAKVYLEKRGLHYVTKNFRRKGGEIDLIMRHHTTLVFIEVRYRQHADHGNGLESITRAKQQRIINTARQYLQQHQLTEHVHCRFDAIAIDCHKKITWIQDAFRVQ